MNASQRTQQSAWRSLSGIHFACNMFISEDHKLAQRHTGIITRF